MLTFLNPIFLWGVAVAVVPLILHLIQRRRTVRLPFSTLRFLKLAETRSASRIRMENLILWLLRTLFVLSLAGAFAMPILQVGGFGDFLHRANRDIALVLDASYSMTYACGRKTAWELATDTALDLLAGLQAGDRVCIVAARDRVDPIIEKLTADRQLAAAALKTLKPSATGSDLASALQVAYEALASDDSRRAREIHIITDGQALPWASMGATGATGASNDAQDDKQRPTNTAGAGAQSAPTDWPPRKLDKRTTFFVTLTGVPAPENVWIHDLRVQPALVLTDSVCRVEATVRAVGTARNAVVSLYVDARKVADRPAGTELGGTGNVALRLPPLPAGVHVVRAETSADNLPLDDAFHFLLHVREALPVLCVGDAADTFFVTRALNPGGASGSIAVKTITPRDLITAPLEDYACVFLCNALPLPGQAIARTEDYVARGGLLAIFPGDRGRASDYEAWQCLRGAAPRGVEEVPATLRKTVLRVTDPPHPLLREIVPAPGFEPILTIQRRLAWAGDPPEAEVAMRCGAQAPFLVTRRYGQGRVVLLAVAANREWSGFPLSPFFLPLAHSLVQSGAGMTGHDAFAWTTRLLPLAAFLPHATPESALFGPDGKAIALRGTAVGARTVVHALDVLQPGIYTMRDDAGNTPVLACNMRRTESNLTPLDADNIPRLVGTSRVSVSRGKEALLRALQTHRTGRTLGELLLWLAFLLAILEVAYANWKGRRGAAPPTHPKVSPSGKLT